MYDIVTRVPAIVWSPGRFGAGRTVDALCQWFDLGPTILELAGVQPDPSMEARSLLPLLHGDPDAEGRDFVFTELARDGLLRDSEYVICARNQEWKIVEFLGSPDGQLYNLIDDPDEVNNLWDDPDLVDHRSRPPGRHPPLVRPQHLSRPRLAQRPPLPLGHPRPDHQRKPRRPPRRRRLMKPDHAKKMSSL